MGQRPLPAVLVEELVMLERGERLELLGKETLVEEEETVFLITQAEAAEEQDLLVRME